MRITLLCTATLLFLLPLMASPASASPTGLFGTIEFQTASLAPLPKWRNVLKRIDAERHVYRACGDDPDRCPFRGVQAWRSKIDSLRDRDRFAQLREINTFLNDWRYRVDPENYGVTDYWATPLEFLGNSGDCEDYAIIKYVSLRDLGYAEDQLRIVVLRDTKRNLAHAVLAVLLDGEAWILDNVTSALMTDRELPHYAPYYSVNAQARWAHASPLEPAVAARNADSTPAGDRAN